MRSTFQVEVEAAQGAPTDGIGGGGGAPEDGIGGGGGGAATGGASDSLKPPGICGGDEPA